MRAGRAWVVLGLALTMGAVVLPGPPALALDWCGPLAISWGYPGVAYVGEALNFSITLGNGVAVPLEVSAIVVQFGWESGTRDWGPMTIPAHDTRTNTHTVALPVASGNYPVSITVNGTTGDSPASECGPFTKKFAVAPLPLPPKVYPWASPASGPAPLAVNFLATVTDGVAPFIYNWSFGDGGTASGPVPTHSYASPGTYVVQVGVTDHRSRSASANLTVVVQSNSSGGEGNNMAGGGLGEGPRVALLIAPPLSAIALLGAALVRRRRRARHPPEPPDGPPW